MSKQVNPMMVARKWRGIRDKHKEQETLLLELMRHPDATPEHIAEVREAYMRTTAAVNERRPVVDAILRKAGYRR